MREIIMMLERELSNDGLIYIYPKIRKQSQWQSQLQ